MQQQFADVIKKGYHFEGPTILLGKPVLDGQIIPEAFIEAPLATMNRHGLVSGATGTGKTKTLQVLAEGLSDAMVPVLLMDIKGDLSGIAAAAAHNDKINIRVQSLGIAYEPTAYPVELFTLSKADGVRLRATVTEFGPLLLSKILELNDTQQGILAMLFKYCDDQSMPLLDLADLARTLQWAANEGRKDLSAAYGTLSPASIGTIMRKVVELQQQGADTVFGEPSFEVDDLMRLAPDGRGIVSVMRVTELQDRPKLFSTFMLQLLSELYSTLPEAGDLDRPKLVLFIDEAHLIFSNATTALIGQLETVIKLIRSKGVGIFFITQNPQDIAPSVLGQLGMKIQHALRAFTAADRKDIRLTAANYPETEFYETEKLITELGIGEALITLLSDRGTPTPLAHTMLVPPRSRMDILTDIEVKELVHASPLADKYNKEVNRESAFEMLNARLQSAQAPAEKAEAAPPKATTMTVAPETDKGFWESVMGTTVKSVARTAGNMLVRGLLGGLGIGSKRRRR